MNHEGEGKMKKRWKKAFAFSAMFVGIIFGFGECVASRIVRSDEIPVRVPHFAPTALNKNVFHFQHPEELKFAERNRRIVEDRREHYLEHLKKLRKFESQAEQFFQKYDRFFEHRQDHMDKIRSSIDKFEKFDIDQQ